MPTIFRQHSAVSCFYCQSNIYPLPRNPLNFRCPYCDCWNRYDNKGEIISEEAAMYDEALNARSFAKRASPRKDRLPSMYGGPLFCHTCQTNQMLLTQLLSKYLPSPEDPQHERRLEMLPEYKRSIEMRYPPVCENCEPLVEEAIRKGDQMARVQALGGALKTTQGTDSRRRSSSTQKAKDRLERELRMWKIRGCLWAGTLICALTTYLSIAVSYHVISLPSWATLAVPLVVISSLLWTAWNPTYAISRRSQFQGRAVRVHGRRQYNIMQIVAWVLRLGTAASLALSRFRPEFDLIHLWVAPHSRTARAYCSVMFACELIILMSSILALKIHYPPPVRLIDTKSHLQQSSATPSVPSTRQSTPAVSGPDLFATLSISNNPDLTARNPIFGVPSLSTTASLPKPNGRTLGTDIDIDIDDQDQDPDAMDVDTSPMKTRREVDEDDGSWLRPQRFFAPEEPTGLESLFAQTIRLADPTEPTSNTAEDVIKSTSTTARSRVRYWVRLWLGLAIIPLCAVGYKVWVVYSRNSTNQAA